MRLIRTLGNIALWLSALLGVIAGGVWFAGQLGLVQPMIVISGSMEPGIRTGDLLIDRWIPTSEVEVGDVLSLNSEMTGKLVTHRVVAVAPADDGWTIRMKGDDNKDEDLETYFPGDRVLTPWVQIPGAGKVVSKVMEPTVAMPILLALVALLGLSLLDEEPRSAVRRVIDRVRQRDPRVDELDQELAAVGVDVERLQEMDDLDLQLYALGIDLDPPAHDPPAHDRDLEFEGDPDATLPLRRNGRGFADGLWDFELSPSDRIDVVRSPNDITPARSAGSEADRVGQRTPARTG